ncbi:MAG: exodeoxyribonuclease VII large subunit [Christensenellales bacterium]|jgi:exodeoxyribonuclease VII large subunit
MGEFVYTVSDVNRFVQRILSAEDILSGIRVRGEISNSRVYASGHRYFTLKDQEALIRCVWFRGDQRRGREARDGMRVIVRGDVGLYVRDGQYQITVRDVVPDGVGFLYERFERLKAALEAEGLFDAARKRPLPPYPRRIGVVTSAHGAAVRDIIRVATRRGAGLTLVLLPVPVQGEGAAERIAAAIDCLSQRGDIDVMIVGRGGGSIEDLWAFNEEVVARAISRSQVPVISAVGHETDFTISDFVADVRAATPSAAAEMAVPDRAEQLDRLARARRQLDAAADRQLDRWRQRLRTAVRMLSLTDPARRVSEGLQRLDMLAARMDDRMAARFRYGQRTLDGYARALESHNPSAALRRGYAVLRDEQGGVIGSASALTPGKRVHIALNDGSACALVETVETGGNGNV